MNRSWTLDLPYPRPPLTLNQRLHWAAKAKITRQIIDDVMVLARAKPLPRDLGRVVITLHWQAKVHRRRDLDNVFPTLKAAIDGLRAYGLVPDDDALHVKPEASITVGFADRLWLSIEDVSDVAAAGQR